MKRRDFVKSLAALGLAAGLPGPFSAAAAELPRAESLLWIGFDGVGLRQVGPLLAGGQLPNLARLAAAGGGLLPLAPCHATLTQPSWMAQITGCGGETTGVQGNYQWRWPLADPNVNPITQFSHLQLWAKPVYFGWTVFKPLKAAGVRLGWFVSKQYLYTDHAFGQIAAAAHARALHYPKDYPGWDYLPALLADASAFVSDQAAAGKRWICFVHLNVDMWGHQCGAKSPEYLAEIAKADAALTPLLDLVDYWRSRGRSIAVAASTDHGFDMTPEPPEGPPEGAKCHGNAPDAWFVPGRPVRTTDGVLTRDVGPTLAGLLGVGKEALHPACYGRDLR